ncbi:MAG: hypothetical protein M5U33_12590 [Pseudorhodoplanes sp.]|nr:hypothetical protein [Pseudorhodoplanes sp.]
MKKAASVLAAAGGLLLAGSGAGLAAPPASCAGKFVGTWTYPGGTTRVNRDGTANPKCPMCVAVQTWTCSGNTYVITGPTSYTATLSGDGRRLVGSTGIVATRVGGAAPAARAPAGGRETPGTTAAARTPKSGAQPAAPGDRAQSGALASD